MPQTAPQSQAAPQPQINSLLEQLINLNSQANLLDNSNNLVTLNSIDNNNIDANSNSNSLAILGQFFAEPNTDLSNALYTFDYQPLFNKR